MRRTENDDSMCCPVDQCFLDHETLSGIVSRFHTPLFLFDEKGLRQQAKSLLSLFPIAGNSQYFPVRKCRFPRILQILREEGMGVQCQCWEELQLALQCGFPNDKILYQDTILSQERAAFLTSHRITVCAGSPLVLDAALGDEVLLHCWLPRGKGSTASSFLQKPGIGFAPKELPVAVEKLRNKGVKKIGLWVRYDGNVTSELFLSKQLEAALTLEGRLREAGHSVERIHLDGGLGVLFDRVKLMSMDLEQAVNAVTDVWQGRDLELSMALGNRLIAPCGIFVSKVLGVHQRLTPVVVLDATTEQFRFLSSTRYHHISISDKTWIAGRRVCNVVGCLPYDGDWFGRERVLPLPEKGDLVILHDAGVSTPVGVGINAVLVCEDGSVASLSHGHDNCGAYTHT